MTSVSIWSNRSGRQTLDWLWRTTVNILKIVGLTAVLSILTAAFIDLPLLGTVKWGLFLMGWLVLGYASLVLWCRAAPPRADTAELSRPQGRPDWPRIHLGSNTDTQRIDPDAGGRQLLSAALFVLLFSFLMEWLFAI